LEHDIQPFSFLLAEQSLELYVVANQHLMIHTKRVCDLLQPIQVEFRLINLGEDRNLGHLLVWSNE
jgi:hypothetical protein